jgi:hypothetical protein
MSHSIIRLAGIAVPDLSGYIRMQPMFQVGLVVRPRKVKANLANAFHLRDEQLLLAISAATPRKSLRLPLAMG